MTRNVRWLFRVALLAGPLCRLMGQTATLNGTVTDVGDARVPGAQIRLMNVLTGEAYQATSNESGNYTIPLLKPGEYQLTAERPGFKQYIRSGILLETGVPSRADVRLEVGGVTESVTVEAQAPLLKSENSSVGVVIENRSITNMPLIDRRAAQLVRLTGNVVQTSGSGDEFSIAGGRGANTMWYIDGSTVQNNSLGIPTLQYNPPVASLQEFHVSMSTYAAELGRTGGGIIQMTTKSGTNQFHGSAYEYVRNDKFDARNFFAAEKQRLRYHLFGASVGGPIVRNRTHFFFNYEGTRNTTSRPQILNVPTPEEARGNFSASSTMIRDPEAAGRPPFPGNTIPASRLDPIGAKVAALYPAPNVPGRASGNSNYLVNQFSKNPRNYYVLRMDHVINSNNRVYGRMLTFGWNTLNDGAFPTKGVDGFGVTQKRPYWNVAGTWVINLSPTLLNEFRLGWDKRVFQSIASGTDSAAAKELAVPGANSRFFPIVSVTGFTGFGYTAGDRYQDPLLQRTIIDNVTKIWGNHTFKTGLEMRISGVNDIAVVSGGGTYGFTNTATSHGLAALLLGWAQSGSINEGILIRSRSKTIGAYLQDDWKITPRLTLNLGLRWDYDEPRWEADNQQNSFDRFALNPVSGTPGIVTFSGRGGISKYAHNKDLNNFGPRFGFAWRVTDRWVVRGGVGLIYLGQYDGGIPMVANLGFSRQGSFTSPDNGLTPAFRLRTGLPAIPPGEALTPAFGAVPVGQAPRTSVTFFETIDRRQGYSESFSFNVQRSLAANMVVEIGYAATLGHKIPSTTDVNINQVRPELMGPGNAQMRRPFPQFNNIAIIAAPTGNSNYHSLNLRAEKRYSHGLHFMANYTWAKLIDDVEARSELGGSSGSGFQNFYDRRSDRGLSGSSIAHRFVWGSVYELPVGKGKAWNIENPVLDRILGGWSSGLIVEARTGPPYGVVEQVNTTNAFSAAQRPNVVGTPKIDGERQRSAQIQQWFNTAAFAAPTQFTFGNAGRINGYGPGAILADLSALKSFRIVENHTLQFRTEMLNFINRPNFNLPSLGRGSPTFGQITSVIGINSNRVIQFGLVFAF